jgi:hypothetical protein
MTDKIKAGDHFEVELYPGPKPCLVVRSPYDDEQYLLVPLQEAEILTAALTEAAAMLVAGEAGGSGDPA